MGTHHVNVGGDLQKKRLDKDGKFKEDFHDVPNAGPNL